MAQIDVFCSSMYYILSYVFGFKVMGFRDSSNLLTIVQKSSRSYTINLETSYVPFSHSIFNIYLRTQI